MISRIDGSVVPPMVFPRDSTPARPPAALAPSPAAPTWQVSSEAEMHLEIRTDDGDVVSLSAHAARSMSLASGGSADAGSSGRLVMHEDHDVQVHVEGHLDRREMHDIRRLLRRIERLMSSFFGGDTTRAEHQAQRIADRFDHLRSLAAFRVDLERDRSISLIQGVSTGAPEPSIDPVAEPLPTS